MYWRECAEGTQNLLAPVFFSTGPSTLPRYPGRPFSCASFNLPLRKFDDLVHLDENAAVVR
jgi:hypothetical protein